MNFLKAFLVGMAFLAAAAAGAAERATKDEAKAMTDAAASHVAKVGWDKAKADFMDKANAEWHRKDLYVFAISMAGVNQAHGLTEKMVGKDMLGMKDPNGREYIKEMIAVAGKGAGWVDYAWPHPDSKKVEEKTSYVKKIPNADFFVGVGAYK